MIHNPAGGNHIWWPLGSTYSYNHQNMMQLVQQEKGAQSTCHYTPSLQIQNGWKIMTWLGPQKLFELYIITCFETTSPIINNIESPQYFTLGWAFIINDMSIMKIGHTERGSLKIQLLMVIASQFSRLNLYFQNNKFLYIGYNSTLFIKCSKILDIENMLILHYHIYTYNIAAKQSLPNLVCVCMRSVNASNELLWSQGLREPFSH